ncbi:hypothetical protein BDB00DRAFT_500962 [Zychaea mexicana]|uniref:uncharacterized protein n=1 Tax=Zychaea mexicana TaxID=64656 RepID=UPI0022FE0DF3|nr:uncharacterized protein BDB00DRAFT_500962 [Zychaea mexicana]KAI9498154.1 hypothetical protein BDB00DRAFT_500962 [Zychaea mexicana]
MPFIAILATCPSLAHLIYSPYRSNCTENAVREIEQIVRDIGISKDTTFPNMSTLSINTGISHSKRLAAVLGRCPNLRVLRINCYKDDWRHREATNIADIFKWCPILEYVECNNTQFFCMTSLQPTSRSINDIIAKYPHTVVASKNIVSRTTGLQELIFYDTENTDIVTAVLHQVYMHQDTLQLLEIGMKRNIPVSWDNLTAIYAPRLRVLRLVNIYCSEGAIANLISHCPCLEELLLHTRSATLMHIHFPLFARCGTYAL